MTNSDRSGGDATATEAVSRRPFATILNDLWHQKPGVRTPRTSASPITMKEVVNGLDRREQVIGWALTAVAVGLALLAYFASASSKLTVARNSALDYLITLLIGALLLALGLLFKRRALLGFASFLFGLEQMTFHYFPGALIYLAFGGWLIYRVMQKNKADRAAGIVPAGSRARSSAPTTHTPKASKRYTPPKTAAKRRP